MEKTIKKFFNYTFDIIAIAFSIIMVWTFVSTLEIAFINPQYTSKNNFNIFVLSESQRRYKSKSTEITQDDDDDDDDEYEQGVVSC